MSLILSFDTSGPHCTVAVLRDQDVMVHRTEEMAKGQAERLMPLVSEAMAEAGHALQDLDAVAVGIGPGNFTGIRLSVAAARGLSLSLGIPAIGVSTLEAYAEGAPRPVLATVDARRGAAYAQRFEADCAHAAELVDAPENLPPELARVGTGSDAVPPALPIAIAIGRIALTRLDAPVDRPAPLYIRAADAAPSRTAPPPLLP